MLYSGENCVTKIIGVERPAFSGGVFSVAPREYSALSFRISGSASFMAAGKELSVNPGDIFYMPQNMPYEAEYTDNEFIVIHFITAADDPEPEVWSIENCENIYKTFLRALDIWKNKAAGFEVFVTARLYDILGMVSESQADVTLPKNFTAAVSIINSSFKDSLLTIDGVCKRAGINPNLFRALFKTHFNKPPTEYITDLRIEAARLLISSGETVENAATSSGFNDPKYFSRVVKKRFGHTPKTFKSYGK